MQQQMMLAACNILSIFSCSVWLVMKTLENMILKNHKTTLMRFLAFSIIYFHFLAILFGAKVPNWFWSTKFAYFCKISQKKSCGRIPYSCCTKIEAGKSTNCGGPLSCEFAIFWKTIWLHQLFGGQKGPHL